jgi:hypothetical protein
MVPLSPRGPVLGLALLLLACAKPVSVEPLAGPDPGVHIRRIAVAPLLLAPQVEREGARSEDVEPEAVEVISARLVEALTLQGSFECVAPAEAELWL